MIDTDVNEFVAFAHKLADAAAVKTLRHFRQRPDTDDKAAGGRMDPVTEADRGAERAIRAMIEASYPTHGIVGEEYDVRPAAGAYEWVIDPLDGTRAFITGLPLWGTLICLQKDGRPIIGLFDQPYIGERFIGRPGRSDLMAHQQIQRLTASACTRLANASLATTTPELFTGAGELAAFQYAARTTRLLRYGGDCYLYGMVAAGHLDLVIEASLKPFDIAALVPIVEGAGGVVSQWSGGPAQLGGRIVAAATPSLHAEAIDRLNEGLALSAQK
ncbi:Histidinol-phosphatase [alternative form] [hydrothermal vent metagenome]|uniref:histidinol-phosphatase n=1 Tax=hydrothermal vent metagenome TaxID=652676 RepID=A0A3B0U2K8_9ZZZZ